MGFHVTIQSFLGERKGFVGLAHAVEDEGFHGLRIAMVGHLLEDLIRSFEAY